MCREYTIQAHFPETVWMNEESLKIRKVLDYFNTMLFRDLVEHYNLSRPDIVRYFPKRMILNMTKPTSINATYNDLNRRGGKLTKNGCMN